MAKKKAAAPKKKKAAGPQTVYQIEVTLENSKPPIWRRLLVPADLPLGELHEVLQIAMGWTDSHLHQFIIKDKYYGLIDPVFGVDDLDTIDEDRVRLSKVVTGEKFKFRYEYDFGDSWMHSILVEKILPADPNVSYPVCVAGKRCGPPEDCGGVWGFDDFVKAMADPAHPEHENLREWYGEDDFDPEAFDIDEINRELGTLR
jgi:hypothetical protein